MRQTECPHDEDRKSHNGYDVKGIRGLLAGQIRGQGGETSFLAGGISTTNQAEEASG
jgi:hypothetical protein